MIARERRWPEDLEFHHDAWHRFQRAVDLVAKSPPQHRTKKKKSPSRKKTVKRAKEYRRSLFGGME